PVPPPVSGTVTLQGYVYRDSANRLSGANAADPQWPRVIQQVDVDAMQTQLGVAAYPFSLRLDTDSTAALVADWPVVTSSPERHTAYAAQWFAMAAVLLLLWLLRSSNLQELIRRKPRADRI
ncbi:MAG: SURF1 family protein, partial [Spongiibacteraceae bacterium]